MGNALVTAIDPGTRRMGIADIWLDGEKRMHKAQAVNVEKMELWEQAAFVDGYLASVLPAIVAIETPGAWLGAAKANKSLAALAELYQLIGALRVVAHRRAADVRIVTDSEVKYAVCGRQAGKKHEVHRVLIGILGYEIPMLGNATCADCRSAGQLDDHSPDAADAMAIAHAVMV